MDFYFHFVKSDHFSSLKVGARGCQNYLSWCADTNQADMTHVVSAVALAHAPATAVAQFNQLCEQLVGAGLQLYQDLGHPTVGYLNLSNFETALKTVSSPGTFVVNVARKPYSIVLTSVAELEGFKTLLKANQKLMRASDPRKAASNKREALKKREVTAAKKQKRASAPQRCAREGCEDQRFWTTKSRHCCGHEREEKAVHLERVQNSQRTYQDPLAIGSADELVDTVLNWKKASGCKPMLDGDGREWYGVEWQAGKLLEAAGMEIVVLATSDGMESLKMRVDPSHIQPAVHALLEHHDRYMALQYKVDTLSRQSARRALKPQVEAGEFHCRGTSEQQPHNVPTDQRSTGSGNICRQCKAQTARISADAERVTLRETLMRERRQVANPEEFVLLVQEWHVEMGNHLLERVVDEDGVLPNLSHVTGMKTVRECLLEAYTEARSVVELTTKGHANSLFVEFATEQILFETTQVVHILVHEYHALFCQQPGPKAKYAETAARYHANLSDEQRVRRRALARAADAGRREQLKEMGKRKCDTCYQIFPGQDFVYRAEEAGAKPSRFAQRLTSHPCCVECYPNHIERSRILEARPARRAYKAWYDNLDVVKERHYQWKLDHPEYAEERQAYLDELRLQFDTQITRRIRGYRDNCRNNGVELDMTDEQITDLMYSDECYYCGEKNHLPDEQGVGKCILGLDRVDPVGHYHLENVVPCCFPCNHMKRLNSQSIFYDTASNIALFQDRGLATTERIHHYNTHKQREEGTASVASSFARLRSCNPTTTLTAEHHAALTQPPAHCSYCGVAATAAFPLGIDRVDHSNKDYSPANTCGACTTCNFIKYTFSADETIDRCRRIHARHGTQE